MMMSNYFIEAKKLKLVLLLLDARRVFGDNDLDILDYLKEYHINFYLVVTKIDKVNQSEKSKLLKHLKEMKIEEEKIYLTSSLEVKTLAKLKSGIEKAL